MELKEVVGGGAARPAVRFPRVQLSMQTARPAVLSHVKGLTAEARFATFSFSPRGKSIAIAFDKPPGALALGVAYGEKDRRRGRARVDPQTKGLFIDFVSIPAAGLKIDVRLRYQGPELVSAIASLGTHRRGRASMEGHVREIFLIDGDGDGRFNGAADRWISLTPERLARTRVLRKAEAGLLGEPQIPFLADGSAMSIRNVKEDGSRLTLVHGPATMKQSKVLARRLREVRASHFANFEHERVEFLEKHEFGERARTDKPATWTMQKIRDTLGGDKPVLVLFYSESNPWCFRYEYYTFRDAEVDRLLRAFTLIRIDIEKDRTRTWQRYRGRGVPALMPLHVDGSNVEFLYRTRDSNGKLSELTEKEKMVVGWQRPQELALNLKRILKAIRATE